MQNIKDEIEGVYRIRRPACPLPLVFDSSHSGRTYPADFGYACDETLLRRAEDNHVDELLETAPQYGITLLCADFPRTYIDANRAIDDIEPDILSEPWPAPLKPTERALSGIGLVRRCLKPGILLYNRKLDINEIDHRIENYYKPYHEALKHLLDRSYENCGQVWHIDWHSMPSLGGMFSFPHTGKRMNNGQADFVLGDRNGTSCNAQFTHDVKDFLKDLGYAVAVNDPYKGVEIVRRYGNPLNRRHSLQIEINKGLYWDERGLIKNRNFNALRMDIEKFSQWLAHYVTERQNSMVAD